MIERMSLRAFPQNRFEARNPPSGSLSDLGVCHDDPESN
jgi:hypothetical protein